VSWSAGNLSRDAEVREEMHQTRVDEALVLLLDASDREVFLKPDALLKHI